MESTALEKATSSKVVGGYDFVNNDADPMDDHGHGTHVASIAGGSGTLVGVAPGASLLAYKVLNSSGAGYYSDIIAAIERAVDPNGDGDSSDHANVINMSLGGPGDPDDALSQAADNATGAGVLVVVAAGNNGGFFTIGSPGSARTALTVGATDKGDQIAAFSSRGPGANLYGLKPEIVAPGVDICAARGTGTELGPTCGDSGHVRLNGTSMATPHVAGAAALLGGLYPSLSPDELKSLLVQNSVDLGHAAFVQGAGRLDVFAAANAHSTVAPAAISFGLDDLRQPSWSPATTLTLHNIDGGPRAYTLSTTPLAAGIGATFMPSTFTLDAGESLDVTMQLSVDNTAVPDVSAEPYGYDGTVLIASGGEQQRVPFAFLKSSRLRLQFDQQPSFVMVHDRIARSWSQGANSATLDFLVPQGTYDVIAQFPDLALVVREGVVVSETTEVAISRSEAGHHLAFSMRDENDGPLSSRVTDFVLTHRASALSIIGKLWSVTDLPVGAVSDAYDFSMAGEAWAGIKDYVVFDGFRDGIHGDRQLGNHGADLTMSEVRYYPRPTEPSVSFINYVSVMFVLPQFSFAFSSGYIDPWPGFVMEQWLNARPFEPFHLFAHKEVDDQPSTRALHLGGYVQQTATPGTVEVFDFGTQPVYTTTTGEVPLNLGPTWWSKQLVNYPDAVGFRWVNHPCIAFRDQGGNGPEVPKASVLWALKSGVAVVASGDFPQSSLGCTSPSYTAVTPGPYEFDIGPMPYFVGGIEGATSVTARFDTSRGDPNPPWLGGLAVRAGGRLTDTVEAGRPVVVAFNVQDEALAQVAITYDNGRGPTTLTPVVTGSGTYQVTLTGLQPGGVAVTLTATDSSGNQLREDFSSVITVTPGTRSADLGVTKSDGLTTAAPGQGVSYGITVTNAGPDDVIGATVSDPVPPGLINATWTCIATAGSSCTTAGTGSIADTVTLRVGGTLTYTLSATVWTPAGSKITNAATVTPPPGVEDGNTVNDSATDEDTVLVSVSVDDVTLLEGNGGAKSAIFTVSLSAAAATTVTVDFATVASTASPGSDYASSSGTLTFLPGTVGLPVAVTIQEDLLNEADEVFFLELSHLTGPAQMADAQGRGTILNDDPVPTLSIGDASVTEGNAGVTSATFTVSLSAPSGLAVSVGYASAPGTASTGGDFSAVSGTLVFSPGTTSQSLSVTVKGDTAVEADETFFVNLANATNATIGDGQGLGTITNDDIPGIPAISINDASVVEGNAGTATVSFAVILSQVPVDTVTVGYATAVGTATAGTDYAEASGTLTFLPGETSQSVSVTVKGDTAIEPDETFYVKLSSPTGAVLSEAQGLGTILDDDRGADFDGDGKPDLLFQNQSTAQLVVWYMDAVTRTSGAAVSRTPVSPTWQAVAVADFNGDGKPDILFQDQISAQLVVWYMDGVTRTDGAAVSRIPASPAWQAVAAADFNADGKPDILFQDQTSAQLVVWYMDGVTRTDGAAVSRVPGSPSWKAVGVADFDGDGKPDILFQEQDSAQLVVWYLDGVTRTGGAAVSRIPGSPSWKAAAIADFNSDGKPDLLFQNHDTGDLVVWYMDGVTRTNGVAPAPARVLDTNWWAVAP